MSRFVKKIEQTGCDLVFASVYSVDSGKRVGFKSWSNPFSGQESKLKKAHAWADKYIDICEKYVTEGC